MALISVVVPIYKVERYLSDCIDSVLQQTFRDFELILVDDGSPDKCGEICETYKANEKKYGISIHVIHRENGGLSAARNSGIDWVFENSNSEWITFIDSDDAIVENYLEALYDAVYNNEAEIATCLSRKVIDEQMYYHLTVPIKDTAVMSGRDACIEQYTTAEKVKEVAWGKLYKRELFSKLRYPEGKINEDEYTTPILLYEASKVVCICNALYLYRYREDSIMNERFSIKRYDGIEGFTHCINYFMEKKEIEIVNYIRYKKNIQIAYFALLSKKHGSFDLIPDEYKMSEKQALRFLKKNCSSIEYDFYLDVLYHKRVVLRAYARKIGLIR